jgi:uncharacterized protein YbaR (Trm112 family)
LKTKPDESLKEILFNELKEDKNSVELIKEFKDEFSQVFSDKEIEILTCPLCRRTIFLERDRSQFMDDFLEKIILPEGAIVKTKTICKNSNKYKIYSEGYCYEISVNKLDDGINKKDDLRDD